MPTALISVSDKRGLVPFARTLHEMGWTIISTGGTARALEEGGVPVTEISKISGVAESLKGRVKTLVPHTHGGLLAVGEEMLREIAALGYPEIGLLYVTFYPLEATIRKPGATPEMVLEQTDIGGPAMVRSAAKGRRIIVEGPDDLDTVLAWLTSGKPDEEAFLKRRAARGEGRVGAYCLESARYTSGGEIDGFIGAQVMTCKYGENPYQAPAGLFSIGTDDPLSIDKFEIVQGTDPSYNNCVDVDRVLQTVTHIAAGFDVNHGVTPYIAVGVKHGNACGAAVDFGDPDQCLREMLRGDPLAIHGGIVMVNFRITHSHAVTLLRHLVPDGEPNRLLDVIVAPDVEQDAIDLLARKSGKCRILTNETLAFLSKNTLDKSTVFRRVRGGFLRQPNYTFVLSLQDPHLWKSGELTGEQENDLLLAWAIGSTSSSNTITLVRNGHLIGNGVGQQARIHAANLAIERARSAGRRLEDYPGPGHTVAYSDSFFPFPDAPLALADAGVLTILTSSGSVHDEAVREACAKHTPPITLVMIPDKLGRGFYGG